MKKNTLILAIIFILSQAVITAQNQLPPALKSVIPDKYKITYELYHKADFIVNIDISLEFPSKYGCDDNLKDPSRIDIGINSIGNKDFAKMQEDMVPFSNYLPTKESHRPQIDALDAITEYSETKIIDLPRGRGAYYTWAHQCIQAQHNIYQGVSLSTMFGNHSTRISIGVNGNIDASEAISVVNELYGILENINFQNL
ncbi:MAG: hypothetical protein Q7V19_02110 [Bacteroidales bacterium]|nr:hypothetical protein [Bacteroidales bacterium]MDP2238428.1 hypothetical protein [Bacteroidales bacterium]